MCNRYPDARAGGAVESGQIFQFKKSKLSLFRPSRECGPCTYQMQPNNPSIAHSYSH